ncbi:MarR family winged helix-turn-helix transcriptional regulator [Nocardia sp. NBC_00511]|uniref:MarR family winged helix-turn-helix transcriptional regulator n=1 Tax=Nocardia sp. NBC_00511 TaxID=2903591 RepID=UPI0030E06392
MTRPTELLEFETMLFGRYSLIPRKGADNGLDRSAYLLLSMLQGEGPLSIGQLSDILGLDASTLNRQTAALLRAGLAERIPDPDGGIARKFRVTADGVTRLDAERAQTIRHLDGILESWPEADIAALAGYLARFNADIESYRDKHQPRP